MVEGLRHIQRTLQQEDVGKSQYIPLGSNGIFLHAGAALPCC